MLKSFIIMFYNVFLFYFNLTAYNTLKTLSSCEAIRNQFFIPVRSKYMPT